MIAAQRRLLREEAEEEEGRNLEVEEDSDPENALSARYDNPETKAFISELIAKMNSGEDIDEYLVPFDGDGDGKLPVEPTKTGFREGSALPTDEAMGSAVSTKTSDRANVKKLEKHPKRVVAISRSVCRLTYHFCIENFLWFCFFEIVLVKSSGLMQSSISIIGCPCS